MQSIYAVTDGGRSFKIGISRNPAKRLISLQTARGAPLFLFGVTEPVEDARGAERLLHWRLSAYRQRGEWFRCDEADISGAFAHCGIELITQANPGNLRSHRPSGHKASPEAFCSWLEAMRDAPIFATEETAAQMLDLSLNELANMKRNGTDARTALACRALFHRLEPWG